MAARTKRKTPRILVRDWDRSGDLADLEETVDGLRTSLDDNRRHLEAMCEEDALAIANNTERPDLQQVRECVQAIHLELEQSERGLKALRRECAVLRENAPPADKVVELEVKIEKTIADIVTICEQLPQLHGDLVKLLDAGQVLCGYDCPGFSSIRWSACEVGRLGGRLGAMTGNPVFFQGWRKSS